MQRSSGSGIHQGPGGAPTAGAGSDGGLELALAPRELFSELVGEAVSETRAAASPEAAIYLVELLVGRLDQAPLVRDAEDQPTLGESLLRARLEREAARRAALLRDVGDLTLFTAGFFSDHLERGIMSLDYYRSVGRAAYADLSSCVALRARQPVWPSLFRELAENFAQFVDVLAEVGSLARQDSSKELLRLYERYLRTGSERARARLARKGISTPRPGAAESVQ